MLQAIVHWSLRFRGIVIPLATVLLAYGIWTATHAKLDVFPDFVPPQVTVQTEAPGLATEQVETLVTRPIENAINGLGNQESLRSETIQGLSVITLVFKDGTDVNLARQQVAEKLSEIAAQLPAGVHPPKMSPLTSSTMDLLKIGLISDHHTPMELRTFADWTLKPRLLAVPGVAKCSVYGGEVRQLQIQVHPDALLAANLTIADVLAAARAATGIAGAGFIETTNQRITLQTDGQLTTPEQIADITIATTTTNALPIRLRDIATVTYAPAPSAGDALIMGRPGVLLTMSSQYGANTMDATRALETALADLAPMLDREHITHYDRLHRPATFIEASLAHIRLSLLVGAALVALVLLLLLGNIRAALISLAAIPLSLLSAVIVLDHFGVTLNTITLGGLAIAIGEVVDDAIIDVENITRRLRENAAQATPRPALDVILSASLEVRNAVVYATLIVICVFIPVLTLSGLQGAFFAPLAKTYIAAILASLLTALTVTPALTALLFHRAPKNATTPPTTPGSAGVPPANRHGSAGVPPADATQSRPIENRKSKIENPTTPRLPLLLRRLYAPLPRLIARHPYAAIAIVLAFVAFALTRITTLGAEFLPDFREGHYVVGISLAPGASLAESRRVGAQISQQLLANPHIATLHQQIGRAELGEDTWGPNKSEFHIELKTTLTADEEAATADEIRATLATIPGIQYEVLTFLGDRIGESISGETSPVVINLFGENLDQLDAKSAEIAAALATVPGAADISVKAPPGEPRVAIRLRPETLLRHALRPADILDTIQTAYQGIEAAQIYRDAEVTPIAVILDDAARRAPENIGALLITTPTGQRIPLRLLADIYTTDGRASILHEGARRRQTITCNPTRDVQSFVADARRILAEKVPLPPGLYIEYAGADAQQRAATNELLLHSAVAIFGIILLLTIVLGHWRNVLLILLNLPFGLAGGVLILWLLKQFTAAPATGTLTMGALVGFVTLFGVTTRNAIMLLSHYDHLIHQENCQWNLDTAIRGASERLIPILMTATVTALGLLPLALHSNEAGCEIEGPMAIVILGGLVTSTTLNLLVLPALALRWAKWKK